MNNQEELQKKKLASFIKNDAKPGTSVTQLVVNEYLKLCYLSHERGIQEEKKRITRLNLIKARVGGCVARMSGMKGASEAIETLCNRRKDMCNAHKNILKGISITSENKTPSNLYQLIEQDETLALCKRSYETLSNEFGCRMKQLTYDGKLDIDRQSQREIKAGIIKIKNLGRNYQKTL